MSGTKLKILSQGLAVLLSLAAFAQPKVSDPEDRSQSACIGLSAAQFLVMNHLILHPTLVHQTLEQPVTQHKFDQKIEQVASSTERVCIEDSENEPGAYEIFSAKIEDSTWLEVSCDGSVSLHGAVW